MLPVDVQLNNRGEVDLRSLVKLSDRVFNNRGDVNLWSLKVISANVRFNNNWDVTLGSLIGGSFGRFEDWSGNIEGINSTKLLNLMISKGIFER
jgi:hypothetical protein